MISKRMALLGGLAAAVVVVVIVVVTQRSSSSAETADPASPTSYVRGGKHRTASADAIAQLRDKVRGGSAAPAADGSAAENPLTPESGRTPNTIRVGDSAIKPSQLAPQGDTETAIARYEAKHGPVNKDQRKALEEALQKKKIEPFPGATNMRAKMLQIECSGPDAQSKYNALDAGGRAAMKQRCGTAGAGLTDPPAR